MESANLIRMFIGVGLLPDKRTGNHLICKTKPMRRFAYRSGELKQAALAPE
jgi:hypothetical protein